MLSLTDSELAILQKISRTIQALKDAPPQKNPLVALAIVKDVDKITLATNFSVALTTPAAASTTGVHSSSVQSLTTEIHQDWPCPQEVMDHDFTLIDDSNRFTLVDERGSGEMMVIEGEFEDQHDGVLPNSTSPLFYFNEGYFVDYVAAPACIGVLGLVSDAASITRVVAETQINAYVIPRARVLEAMSIFTRPPSFLYHIWHHIARVVASLVLQTDTKYQTWPLEKISRRLESFLLPDLSECNRFQLTSDIQEAVLVQGIALDTETQDLYTAPVCLPSKPMRLVFPQTRETRVRNVLLLVAEDTYKVPLEYDWLQKKSGDEDREAEYNERFWGRERGFDHEGSLKQYSVEPSSL
ncbi:uncharacterized protein LOC135375446 [Ornithodoros turicata]|uniref:uncharacterized protein LOC135375446 n=1 Tax=Ornithodoros turicata TaxID=34597 RepID=UPI0031394346